MADHVISFNAGGRMKGVPVFVAVVLAVVGSVLLAQDAAPKMSEVQSLKMQLNYARAQVVQQQFQLLQAQMADLERERAVLASEIERENPGWKFDAQNGRFIKADAPPKK